MVDCTNRVRLDAYHDGELSPAERSVVEAHLRECPACAAELAAMQRTSTAFAGMALPEPSNERLMQVARDVRGEASDARVLLRLFRATAVAAGVLIACSVAGAVYLSWQTKAAAREAMLLDHVASGSQSAAFAGDVAQWIADDLSGGGGGQEER